MLPCGKISKICSDAFAVEKNIESQIISVIEASVQVEKGDQALIAIYRKEDYDAIATDDTKLCRQLKALNIPFILPALVLYRFYIESKIDYKKVLWALQQLSEFISEDEFSTVRLLVEKKK